MREIKFRAFDPEEQAFFYFSLGDIETSIRDGSCRAAVSYLVELEMVQQFVGLKDKNGKEIYEGDILRISKDSPPFTVSWSMAALSWDCEGVGLHELNDGWDLEVIGNQFENPELLQEQQ